MRFFNRRNVVLLLTLGVLQAFACAPLAVVAEEARPNVVLVMTDDMGYGDLGFHGNPVIDTPHLDQLAASSSLIKQFYVSPVCAPTRACLMTGRYNYRTRAIDTYIGRAMMDTAEVTVAEMLAEAGYETGIFGKWHLGDNYPMRPMDQGFQYSVIHRGGGIGQPSDPPGGEGKYTDPILFRNGKAEQMTGYCTDVYYREAFDFIAQAKEKQKPFFVYLPDNCPHGPFHDVPPADYQAYRKKDLNNSAFPQTQGHKLPKNARLDQRARIFAMVTNVDRNVGRLLKKLDELDLAKNTIVIFMVDNGPNGRRYVAGMFGNKSMVHEGGVRSPFFIRWPAGFDKRRELEGPYAHIDVMPTLLEACGVAAPNDVQLDGVSFLPGLMGRPEVKLDRAIVIQSHRGDRPVPYHNFMIRKGPWKMLHESGFGRERFEGNAKLELYNLEKDPFEQTNLMGSKPDVVRDLKQAYDAWFKDVSSTRKDNYTPPRIVIGTEHETTSTLTRQDWRHTQGRPWAADSLGHWLLEAPAEKKYNIVCRFKNAQVETLTLRVNGRELGTQATNEGQESAGFQNVELPSGHIKLELELSNGSRVRGVYQTDVSVLD